MIAGRRFQRLQWKLTLSYTLVTVAALLVVELLLLGGGALLFDWLVVRTGALARVMQATTESTYAPAVRPYLVQDPPSREGIDLWLRQFASRGDGSDPPIVIVLGREGNTLGASDSAAELAPQLAPLVAAALEGERNPQQLAWTDEAAHRLWLAAPVLAQKGTGAGGPVAGVLVQSLALPRSSTALVGDVLPLIGLSFVVLAVLASTIGALFGWLTSRNLVRRLDRLALATAAWSRGDFRAAIADQSADELGQLARRLNAMAQQLENVLVTRQQLAVLKERNRLALDLHDSAKQQAFAVAAQLGAARALLRQDPALAAVRLDDAERLADSLRRELTNLVYELRPLAPAGTRLPQALREYAEQWSMRNNIRLHLALQEIRPLSIAVEETILRVAQEALANVARHSGAAHVELSLAEAEGEVVLAIGDNGCGFAQEAAPRGVGLDSMRQRAQAIGAHLAVESAPGCGARVLLTVRSET
jgi:NarL family two-component system sensor histidine kinase LiaS